MLVTLPCVLLLLDYWPLGRLKIANLRLVILEKLPLFALSAASCLVTLYAQQQAISPLEHINGLMRLANALVSYSAYIVKMFCPLNLAILYPYPSSWPLWQLYGSGFLLVSVTIVALWQVRRRPYLLVGWLWYVGTLVPVIGLVQVGRQQMADRYSYIPLIGLFLLLVWGVADLLAPSPRRRPLLAALAVLVLVPCVALSWRQAGTWRDSWSLWNQALGATTNNHDACLNVGALLDAQGQTGHAIVLYRQALTIAPDDPQAHFLLGRALSRQGKTDEATAHLTAGLQINTRQSKAHHLAYAEALVLLGRLDEGQRAYEEVLQRDPRDAVLLNDLGTIYFKSGKLQEAGRCFAGALEINPNLTQAHNNLGSVLVEQGQLPAAVDHFAAALRTDPKNALAHCNRGAALARLGRREEAAVEFQAALRLQPDFPRARQGLQDLGATRE
jgi:tetratricopeptide (TPR) repeat protein